MASASLHKCAGRRCTRLVEGKPYCSASCFSGGEKREERKGMVDLKKVGVWLIQRGLMDKPFSQFTEGEMRELISVIFSSPSKEIPIEGWEKPSLGTDGLTIPLNVHPSYYWWKPEGKPIADILTELQAPEEIRRAYISNDGVPF